MQYDEHSQHAIMKQTSCLQGSQITSGSGVFGLRGFGLVDFSGVFEEAFDGVFDRDARLRTPEASIDVLLDTEAAATGADGALGGVVARAGEVTRSVVTGSGVDAGAGAGTGAADDAEVGDTARAAFAEGDVTGGAGAASE